MYPPPHFNNQELDEAVAIAGAVRFATLMPMQGDACEAVFAPFMAANDVDGPLFLGHLLRTNPLRLLTEGGPFAVRLVFHAGDGYVSPSVYAEKPISGKVVPTWNYVAAQFTGQLEAVPDEELMALLERQVDDFEQAAGSDWKLHDAPGEYLDMMSRAIFGVRFTPTSWRVHRKLSQNRPAEAQSITDWLAAGHAKRRSIAGWMAGEFDDVTVSEPDPGN